MTEETVETLPNAEVTNAGGSPAPETTGGSSQPEVSKQQAPDVVLDPPVTEGESDAAPPSDAASTDTPAADAAEATADATPPEDPWKDVTLKGPEGSEPEALSSFGDACKKAGVAPDAAQKVLDDILPHLRERALENAAKVHEQWATETKADKLLGGEKFDENMGVAKKAAEVFGDPDLQELLKPVADGGQGLGNHPAISRLLFRVGKAIRTDNKVVTGDPAGSETKGPMGRLADKYEQREAAAKRGE